MVKGKITERSRLLGARLVLQMRQAIVSPYRRRQRMKPMRSEPVAQSGRRMMMRETCETTLERNGNPIEVVVSTAFVEEINPTDTLSAEVDYVPDRAAGRTGRREMRSLGEHVLDIPRVRKRRAGRAAASTSSRKRSYTRNG